MNTLKNYVLDSYIRVGDVVICQVDQETRGWLPNKYKPDGTKGVITGFTTCKTYVERNRVYGDQPGSYLQKGCAVVQWEDGTSENVSAFHVCPEDQTVLELRRIDEVYKTDFEAKAYIGPLPETKYYEGDEIILTEHFLKRYGLNSEPPVFTIVNIDYYRINEFCNDGVTPYPCYQIEPKDKSIGLISARESDIAELSRRGNYWRMEHGEPLEFKDTQDKIHFYYSIGKCVQQKSPTTGNYVWSIEDIVKVMEEKTIAFIKMSPSLFGAIPRPNAYSIPEFPEVEEEVRQLFKIDEFRQMLREGNNG